MDKSNFDNGVLLSSVCSLLPYIQYIMKISIQNAVDCAT